MKVLADQAGFRMRRRCLELPRCRGDAVRRVGVSTPSGLLHQGSWWWALQRPVRYLNSAVGLELGLRPDEQGV